MCERETVCVHERECVCTCVNVCVSVLVANRAQVQTSDALPVAVLGVAESSHNLPLHSKHNLHTILTTLLDNNRGVFQLGNIS